MPEDDSHMYIYCQGTTATALHLDSTHMAALTQHKRNLRLRLLPTLSTKPYDAPDSYHHWIMSPAIATSNIESNQVDEQQVSCYMRMYIIYCPNALGCRVVLKANHTSAQASSQLTVTAKTEAHVYCTHQCAFSGRSNGLLL